MGDVIWALGMMSGTSMDGIDAAMLSTDGHTVQNFGRTYYQSYTNADRHKIKEAVAMAHSLPTDMLVDRTQWPQILVETEAFITQRHIELLHQLQVKPDVIGIHGQTLIHRPNERVSLQILDGRAVAEQTGLTVVNDMRANDLAHGGQGAPLVPFYHFALAKRANLTGPVAFLNIGGVSNVTWINPQYDRPEEDGALLAFDTGTGVALLNDWISERTDQPYDVDGVLSGQGCVDERRLRQWQQNGYFEAPPPKSLDRDEFKRMIDVSDLSVEDGAATLCAFTAHGVARALAWMPAPPRTWFVCGGGRYNKTLVQMLSERLDGAVRLIDTLGLDGDQVEAQAFAYLAARRYKHLSVSAPGTTGCDLPVTGGEMFGVEVSCLL